MTSREEHNQELHRILRKIQSKLRLEIFGHIIAVIIFSALVIITLLKYRDVDLKKLLVALIAICHFGLIATAILYLKYCGVKQLNPMKCKIWVYLEVYNITATTAFIVLATRHLLLPPFHQWTGLTFLLLVYWLPLVLFKTSQVIWVLELVNILKYLQEDNDIHSLEKNCNDKSNSNNHHQLDSSNSNGNILEATASPQGTSAVREFSQVPKSALSPHVPYELALIESMSVLP